jgi:O-antigen ligase
MRLFFMSANDIFQRLNPINPVAIMTVYGIWLYVVMLLALIMLFVQKTPSQPVTLLLVATMLFALVDKVGVGHGGADLFPKTGEGSFPLFFIRIALFVFPLIATGVSKTPKSRPWGFICALLAAIYFLVRGMAEMGLFTCGPYCK